MRTAFALLLVSGGVLMVYSAFKTPPDPRVVLANLIGGKPPGEGLADPGAGITKSFDPGSFQVTPEGKTTVYTGTPPAMRRGAPS